MSWKAERTAKRRAEAEARQKIYEAKPMKEKLRQAGVKEKKKLLSRMVEANE